MVPFVALEVRGPVERLDLPPELGKISPWVNVRRPKFFEQLDADFSDFDAPAVPVTGSQGVLRNEIHRIWGHRPPNALPAKEYLVQWKGFDTSQMTWVSRVTLSTDVPGILAAYETASTTSQARPSAPNVFRNLWPLLVLIVDHNVLLRSGSSTDSGEVHVWNPGLFICEIYLRGGGETQ